MDRTTCPFCNAAFDAPPAGRVLCPRCGEALPGRGEPVAAPLPRPAPARPRAVRPVVVGAVVLFAFGAAYSTLRKPRPTPEPPPPPAAAGVPPGELAGLAYLPAGSNVVFAVRPGPLLDFAARSGQNPVEMLVKAGVPAGALAALGAGGVPLDGIDHVAGGAVVPDGPDLATAHLAVALVLRRPVADEAKFLAALKARRNGAVHDAEFAGLPVKLRKAADAVWLLGWTEWDVADAGNGLQPRVRAALDETFPPDTAAFVFTDAADWAAKPSVNAVLTLTGRGDWLPGVARVRAVAAGMTVADTPTLRVLAAPATPVARADLLAAFRRHPGTTGETGGWVTHASPADGAGGLAALQSVFAPH